jgi:hypothetical protein
MATFLHIRMRFVKDFTIGWDKELLSFANLSFCSRLCPPFEILAGWINHREQEMIELCSAKNPMRPSSIAEIPHANVNRAHAGANILKKESCES